MQLLGGMTIENFEEAGFSFREIVLLKMLPRYFDFEKNELQNKGIYDVEVLLMLSEQLQTAKNTS